MNAKANEADSSSRASYDRATKDLALKILMDYSAKTGKKWTAIRAEIMAGAGAKDRDDSLLSRQSLEAWASRKSDLGDEKFKWIYKFLTLPKTLARSEFSEAINLIDSKQSVILIGRTLARLLAFPGNVTTDKSTDPKKERTQFKNKQQQTNLDDLSGIYTDTTAAPFMTTALFIHRPDSENFFIAHLVWLAESNSDHDWNINLRLSGFATLGHDLALTVGSIFRPPARTATLYPVPGKKEFIMLEWNLRSDLAKCFYRGSEATDYVHSLRHARRLTSSNNKKLLEMFEEVKWSMPKWL